MPRFTVVMVSSVFYPSIGGAQTHTLRLSQKLQERDIGVKVLTRHHRGLAPFESIAGVPTYRVGRGDSNKAIAALTFISGAIRWLVAQRSAYDLIHCHQMISPMTTGLFARALLGKPLVINPHRSGPIGDVGVLLRRRRVTGRLRIAAARRWGDAFVSISDDIHRELHGIGIREERIWDIVNGVDVERFRPVEADERARLRTSLGVPTGPLVVFAGRLAPEKGVDVLLEAWPRVVSAIPDAHLLLLGEGEQRAELEGRVQSLKLGSSVTFAGGTADVSPFLQAADAFVLPSRAEGLPVALLEAMACGLPCVGTAISGTLQVLEQDRTGQIVPVNDAAALADGLLAALRAPEARAWAAQARRHVVEHYSLDVIADRYVDLYSTLLQSNASYRTATQHEPGA